MNYTLKVIEVTRHVFPHIVPGDAGDLPTDSKARLGISCDPMRSLTLEDPGGPGCPGAAALPQRTNASRQFTARKPKSWYNIRPA
jgi:hypothetical protein